MRTLRYKLVIAAGLLAVGWAQQRVNSIPLKKPTPEKVQRIWQMMDEKGYHTILLPLDDPDMASRSRPQKPSPSQMRTTTNVLNLPFLRPHQDADTVPTTANTNPFQVGSGPALYVAGDTLMASGVGGDLVPTLSDASLCEHLFFDSLGQRGAYLGGYIPESGPHANKFMYVTMSILDKWDEDADTAYYHGGGAAQRYWFSFNGLDHLYVKGIAAFIIKDRFRGSGDGTDPGRCQIFTPSFPDWDGDNTPEVTFFIARADTATYGSGFGLGTYVSDILASDTVPYSQMRIGSLASATGQCVAPEILTADIQDPNSPWYNKWQYWLFERLHYLYFSNGPVRVGPGEVHGNNTAPDSMYYVGLLWELPADPGDPPPGGWQDTFFIPIGPFSNQGLANHPCLHDTLYYLNLGRCMRVFGEFNTADLEWQGIYFFPERTMWLDREGYLLDFPIFPIISAVFSNTSSQPSRPQVYAGREGFSLPYPNPITDCMKMQVDLPAAATVSFFFYGMDGRVVYYAERQAQAGTSELHVDVPNLAPGTYNLFVRSSLGGGAAFAVTVLR